MRSGRRAERTVFVHVAPCLARWYGRSVPGLDLNLLVALDVLLAEGNVTRAAQRLRLSPSAMSRTLARLRAATGDPLLVRAGRGLVPTPRAAGLREKVRQLVEDSESVLRPAGKPELETVARTFTLRTSDGFVENFGPDLVARVAAEAPGVRLCFVQKVDKESAPLRDGIVDLETGVVASTTGPEIRAQALFRDRLVGVVRAGHALAAGEITPARYASGRHVLVSREGLRGGAVDEALLALGLERQISAIVGGFASALALARGTELIATVPERHTTRLRDGMYSFPLPFPALEVTVSMLWHPRLHADPVHQWLRECVRAVCSADR